MIPFLKKNKDGKKPPKPTVPRTAQESIPFQRMFEDGTFRIRPGYYTRTIQYQDINYQLAQQEDKTAIFEEWCSFLNFFDSSIHFELSFVNTATDSADFEKSIRIPYQQDGFDDVRAEYSQMLRQQLSKGNNGLTKTKFLTYGIEGDSMEQVKPRLEHIQNDLMNNFHRLGVLAKPLDGTERLRLMHGMLNMDGANKFHFNWKDLVPSGLSVKDAIAPTALAFKNSRTFQMGGIFGAVSFLNITASDLSDQLLKDFLDMDSSQIVTMHIQSVDQNKAIKTIKRTITELDRSKIEEQKKAVRAGYDMDVLPSDLATYGRDAKALLKELQSQNERMFLVTFLVLNTGKTEQELETNVFQAVSIAQKHNCELCRLDFQQEQGLMSSLPLADCQIEIQRGLTTSSTAIFVPFTTQELFDNGKESLYYGLNALSNNLIMVDRKKLKNPNGLILGTPGSGKSFSAKREICNAFLVTDDDIIICDPEAEYAPLVERLHGQVIHISPASTQYINPMDINSNYSEEDNPLALKADFVLSLCELVVGGKEGLQPVEKTVIDRCVHVIYRKYFENPTPENMPLLEDLYNALLTQDEPEARHVAAALEIYVKDSLNIFNHRTNVDIDNRIVCYDIKQLGKQLKKLGMLIVQDQVWGRVTANRSSGKSTRYYIDEMHRYSCFYKIRHPGDCDGQSGYGVSKLDSIVEEVVRQIFAQFREVSRKKLLESVKTNDAARIQKKVKKIQKDLESKQKELDDLKAETILVIRGVSALDKELLGTLVAEAREALETLEKQLVQAQEEYEEATKTAKRSNYICNELFTWADVYDTANHDERRAILQQFIKEIRVRKDYEISITLNASFNQVEQLKAVSTYDGAEIFEEISEKGA